MTASKSLNKYAPTRARIHFNENQSNVLDVLTSGVTFKHELKVDFTPAARTTIFGAVGILAGAALLAVMIARR
jgi:hypothetical protein